MNKQILQVSCEKLTLKRATCRPHDQKVKSHVSLEDFTSVSRVRHSRKILVKHSIWKNVMFCFTKYLSTLYIPSLPINCKKCFFREKTLENTLKSQRLLYPQSSTHFLVVFLQLLPLHLYNLERLIAQTLTTPILTIK